MMGRDRARAASLWSCGLAIRTWRLSRASAAGRGVLTDDVFLTGEQCDESVDMLRSLTQVWALWSSSTKPPRTRASRVLHRCGRRQDIHRRTLGSFEIRGELDNLSEGIRRRVRAGNERFEVRDRNSRVSWVLLTQ